MGYRNRAECKFWPKPEAADSDSTDLTAADVVAQESVLAEASNIPWNGYTLGIRDLAILGGRGSPLVIGLIGPPNSGKTSLLAFIYMWLLEYGSLEDWQFAGSCTLGGWESIVQFSRWDSTPPPSFPPHTSSTGRHPGILHLTFRDPEGRFRDVMFTDAPGEWFTQWSRVPNEPVAAGARWVINHADALLLLIDSVALADPKQLPKARRATRDILERIGATSLHLPMMTVWTKDDTEVAEKIRQAIEKTCLNFVPKAKSCRTTTHQPETIVKCFVDILVQANCGSSTTGFDEPRLSKDPFLAFRGIYVNT
jgi:hypothetical protein